MSHDFDVRATSHDHHDPMLVAAHAAGDLAGAERGQAIALTRTCTSCSALYHDLIAIARATAVVPPPYASSGRDFRLTPAQAARLRPAGWRRLLSFGRPRLAIARPIGAGLATIGIVGLLIGSLPLGLPGSAASAPAPQLERFGAAANPAGGASFAAPAASDAGGDLAPRPAGSAAASAAPGPASLGSNPPAAGQYGNDAAASAVAGKSLETGGPLAVRGQAPGATKTAAGANVPESPTDQTPSSWSPNALFGVAIVIGLGLIVASRRRGNRSI